MKKTKKAIFYLLTKITIISALIFILFYFFLTIRIVQTNDMWPKIVDGDLVFIQKTQDIVFDEVVLYKDINGFEHYGRVVAVSGDTVDISNAGLLINGGVRYDELPYKTEKQEHLNYPILLQENEYFILSDLRDQVVDSRTFGPIKSENIIGKEIFLIRRRGF